MPVYSWDEISKHNCRESCWLVVKGKVYDVTEFIPKHPAGEKAILRHAGQECTEDFLFHSPGAQKLWHPYCIGSVEGADAGCVIL
jgi:L-lactate dehydrogenase (cytochrome)